MASYSSDLLASLRQYQLQEEKRKEREPNWLAAGAGGLAGLLSGGGLGGAGLGALGGIGAGQGATGVARGALTGYTYGSGLAKAATDAAEEAKKKADEVRKEKAGLKEKYYFKNMPEDPAKVSELVSKGWQKMDTPWGDRLGRDKDYDKKQKDIEKTTLGIQESKVDIAKKLEDLGKPEKKYGEDFAQAETIIKQNLTALEASVKGPEDRDMAITTYKQMEDAIRSTPYSNEMKGKLLELTRKSKATLAEKKINVYGKAPEDKKGWGWNRTQASTMEGFAQQPLTGAGAITKPTVATPTPTRPMPGESVAVAGGKLDSILPKLPPELKMLVEQARKNNKSDDEILSAKELKPYL